MMTDYKIGDRTYALMVDRIAESEGKVDQLAGINADLMLANKALRARVAELDAENEQLRWCFLRMRNSLNTDSQHFTIFCLREEVEMLRDRVAELVARLLNLVTAVELSSAVVVSQSVSEAMADARQAIAGKEGE